MAMKISRGWKKKRTANAPLKQLVIGAGKQLTTKDMKALQKELHAAASKQDVVVVVRGLEPDRSPRRGLYTQSRAAEVGELPYAPVSFSVEALNKAADKLKQERKTHVG